MGKVREKCLSVGMDDSMAKPIKKEMVLEMIMKWKAGEGR